MSKKIHIAILGSTGSIGQQTLEVIKTHSDLFSVELLTANENSQLLIKQAVEFDVNTVIIANENKYKEVDKALFNEGIKVFSGINSISDYVSSDNIDVVLSALAGFAGLLPTIAAIKAGKKIALANKETMVVAGEIINKLTEEYNSSIIPVDSEHSAIFQCLIGENHNRINKIYLTASGGPFKDFSNEELKKVNIEQALNHPQWQMGNKITIDSATLMNKGLEAIEAKWLFNINPNDIEIVIHPESIIHSMVKFDDGSVKAQMGLPDMKTPIKYALFYPYRISPEFKEFNLFDHPTLNFQKPDYNKFKLLQLAIDVMKAEGSLSCTMNAANEIAVEKFLNKKISFNQISEIVYNIVENSENIKKTSINDLIEIDNYTRIKTLELIKKYNK